MITLRADSANELYTAACRALRRNGRVVRPRGMATTEVLGAHLCLTDPRRRYVDLRPTRVINPAFAVAEAMWILSGSDDEWIYQYNRALVNYADNGRLQGAYGPRMRRWRGQVDQLDHVRRLLSCDPDSRQAVIQLYDPVRDTCGHRDVPCTLGYRFYLRDGRLHMLTTMRSQDLWLGFPYDIFTATLLQELLAGWLGAQLGEYHHHIDSLHLYEEHLTAAGLVPEHATRSPQMPPVSVAWESLPGVVAGVISGDLPSEASGVWAEFAAVMASYRMWTVGDRIAARALAASTAGDLSRALERWYEHLRAKRPAGAAAGPGR